MAFLGQEEQLRELQDRFKFLHAAVFIGMGILVTRLVFLQILQGDNMRRYSEENRIKRVEIPAPRGMIFDRNRTLLIDNRPAFDLEVTPQYLKESGKEAEVTTLLSRILRQKRKRVSSKIKKAKRQAPFLPFKVKTDLNRNEVAKLESWKIQMPGVSVQTEIKRTNTYGDTASHLLGYIGKINSEELQKNNAKEITYKRDDDIGKAGIEKQMEDILRGRDGEELVEVDALGRRIREQRRGRVLSAYQEKPAIPGKNLILTIDQDLQEAAKQAFDDKAGGLVAIDPKSGAILSMISRPSFNPTEFSRGFTAAQWKTLVKNPDRPLKDKTIQDHYPPGSVFKVISAVTALEEGIVTPKTTFRCPGAIRVGRRLYHCHKRGGHGTVNLFQAISRSCDVYFYRVAQKLKSVDLFAKWAKKFGLGERSGVDLPREVPGLIPTEGWKKARYNQPWTAGESLSVAIGQSFVLTTVIQLANLYATIANGGTLYRPYFIKAIESPDGDVIQEFKPSIVEEVEVNPETLEWVKRGLWGVVNDFKGTAFSQRLPGMNMAGKTGTSQVIRRSADKIYEKCKDMKYRFRHHGLFAAFAPSEDSVIAVAVLAEHACYGSRGAAPIAKAVVDTYLKKKFPEKYTDEYLKQEKKRDLKRVRAYWKSRQKKQEAQETEDQQPARDPEAPVTDLDPAV